MLFFTANLVCELTLNGGERYQSNGTGTKLWHPYQVSGSGTRAKLAGKFVSIETYLLKTQIEKSTPPQHHA